MGESLNSLSRFHRESQSCASRLKTLTQSSIPHELEPILVDF